MTHCTPRLRTPIRGAEALREAEERREREAAEREAAARAEYEREFRERLIAYNAEQARIEKVHLAISPAAPLAYDYSMPTPMFNPHAFDFPDPAEFVPLPTYNESIAGAGGFGGTRTGSAGGEMIPMQEFAPPTVILKVVLARLFCGGKAVGGCDREREGSRGIIVPILPV